MSLFQFKIQLISTKLKMGALIKSQEAKRNCGTLEEEKEGKIALRIINTYPKASVIETVKYFCSNRKTDTDTWYYPLS